MGTSQGKGLVGALAMIRESMGWLLVGVMLVLAGFALIPIEWRKLVLALLQQQSAERQAFTPSPTEAGGILPLDQNA